MTSWLKEVSLFRNSPGKQSPTAEQTVSHGNISLEINNIQESERSPEEEASANESAALETFLTFFKRQEGETRAHKVATALAQDSLQRLADGKKITAYTSQQVAEMAGHNVQAQRATGWLSKVWGELESRLEAWEVGVQDTARQAGLTVYAWPKKTQGAGGAGNSSSFGIVFLPVPETEEAVPISAPGTILYARDLRLKPAFWVKRIVEAGFALKGWRRKAFLAYGLGGLVIFGLVLVWLWVVLTTGWASLPIGGAATLLLLAAMVGWVAVSLLRPFWRLIDLRIIMAPDILVSFSERGVQLEAAKERDDEGNQVRVIRLVRYSGDCPVCGETVHLEDGRREFPGRLVGRCDEHPAEHVFSFDRHTRSGRPLR